MKTFRLFLLLVPVFLIAGTAGTQVADTDGWGGITNLSDDGITQYMGYGYQHTIATDTGGNVHVVWYDDRTGTNQVYYRKWSKQSGSWGAVVQVTNQAQAVYRPAVACDYSGNVHVVWYHSSGTGTYGVWYKKWSVATETWGDSLQLYYPGGNYLNYYPSIVCRPGGDNVHVVWYGRDASSPTYFRIRHIEYTPGVGWGSITTVDQSPSDSNENASVAVDRSDSVYVVWRRKVSGYPQIFYRWRTGTGVWRNIEQVSNVNPNAAMFAPAVSVDTAGTAVHVVWNGDIPGNANDRIFYRVRTASGWSSTEIVSTYGDGSQYDPVVVAAPDGAAHFVWRGYTDVSASRQEVLYRQKRAGAWSEVMQLTNRSSGSNVLTPALAVGEYDDLHIAWYDNTDGDNDVYYIRGQLVDAGISDILYPSGTIPRASVVVPTVIGRNFGNYTTDLRVFCFLVTPGGNRVYTESLGITALAPQAETTLIFPVFTTNEAGVWTVRCSTVAVMDKNQTNDWREGIFFVVNTNIEMFQIQAPAGTVDSGTVVTPRGRWWNRGREAVGFTAYFKLFNPAGSVVYSESAVIANLADNRDTIINFSPYTFLTPGTWRARCSTFCINDTFPGDDVRSVEFVVRSIPHWPYGWHEVKPVPLLPSNKGVGDGGWITQMRIAGVRYLFALKGNKVGDFYIYNPIADTWHQLSSMPLGREGRYPRRASVGVAGGDYIYATKGNNTLGFWRYNVELNLWEQLIDVPLGSSGKRVKAGTDMLYIKRPRTDTGYVYLLKGYTDEFYRFNTISNSWETLAPAPLTLTGRRWDRGSWLAYQARPGQGEFYIYAHKGKYHELWKYDVLADTWFTTQLRGMPFIGRLGKAKKCKDGSAGTWYNDAIYALKGGNTCEFWRYDALGDSWVEMDTIPSVGSTGRKKRVKGGGDIVFYEDGVFFALKGNKTPELWCYVVADTDFAGSPSRTSVMATTQDEENRWLLIPNPLIGRNLLVIETKGTLKADIFDITGRKVLTQWVGVNRNVLNLSGLKAGVYLLRLTGDGISGTRKLIVE